MDFSAGTLIASMLVSTIGFGLFLYGKRATRFPQLLCGLALMVFPYFTGSVMVIYGVGTVVLGGLWLAVRSGM